MVNKLTWVNFIWLVSSLTINILLANSFCSSATLKLHTSFVLKEYSSWQGNYMLKIMERFLVLKNSQNSFKCLSVLPQDGMVLSKFVTAGGYLLPKNMAGWAH